jgi:dTMP kinase
MGCRFGKLITMEGPWGVGKSTVARQVGDRIAARGFRACVLGYGCRDGVIGGVSRFLDEQPLRSRSGAGGFAQPHHPAVDVLLRLCREASNHAGLYRAALKDHDLVILDHGVYTKLAYYLAVLLEQQPGADARDLLDTLLQMSAPWSLAPDRAFYLDVPWPLARERAIARSHRGGNPGSLERLLFLPRYDDALRYVMGTQPGRVVRIAVGLRPVPDVADLIEGELLRSVFRVPSYSGGTGE